MPNFRRDYKADYAAFEEAVRADERFCFVRFNDGEFALLQGKPYRAASGWRLRRGKESWLQEPLLASLRARLPGYHVGVSSPCCVPRAVPFYRREAQSPSGRLTFSTLFFNCNYMRAMMFLRELKSIVVSSGQGDIKVPGDGVTREWDIDSLVEELLEARLPILVAAGPSACVIGHRYWERALERQTQDRRFRPQSLIDVGATLDTVVHGKRTRQYHDASNPLRGHVCAWNAGVQRSGMAAQSVAPIRPPPRSAAQTTPPEQFQHSSGLTAATSVSRELDVAVRASQGGTFASQRKKVKEHMRRQVGTGAWARRRTRRKKR